MLRSSQFFLVLTHTFAVYRALDITAIRVFWGVAEGIKKENDWRVASRKKRNE